MRTGENLPDWFTRLSGVLADRPAMHVDYDTYAEGEALLGWLNATYRVTSSTPFDGNRLLQTLTDGVQSRLAAADIEIAHCKMTLSPEAGTDLAVVNLVRTDGRIEFQHRLAEDLSDGELILNLRAEGDPETLKTIGDRRARRNRARSGRRRRGRTRRALPSRPARAHTPDGGPMSAAPRILYCHCAFAKVVPVEVKTAVLAGLSDANVEFDAVPDLCEMAARGDARLRELAAHEPLRVAACFPRAVRWLFSAADATLPEQTTRVWNMRTDSAESVLDGLLDRRTASPEGEPA